jgi:hypothetical protein
MCPSDAVLLKNAFIVWPSMFVFNLNQRLRKRFLAGLESKTVLSGFVVLGQGPLSILQDRFSFSFFFFFFFFLFLLFFVLKVVA